MPSDLPVAEQPPGFAEEPLPLPLLHRDVPGERTEQRDVLLRRVLQFPVVLLDQRHLEQPGRGDLRALCWQPARPWPAHALRQLLADRIVDQLDLVEERVAADLRQHVRRAPEGKVTALAQRFPRALVAHRRVDPVPGGGRVHQREPAPVPVLEPPVHHLDAVRRQVLPRTGREFLAEFDASDPVPARGQRPGRLPGRAAHLEQPVAGLDPGGRDQVLVQLGRVLRPGPVVAVRRLPERLAQRHPLGFGGNGVNPHLRFAHVPLSHNWLWCLPPYQSRQPA